MLKDKIKKRYQLKRKETLINRVIPLNMRHESYDLNNYIENKSQQIMKFNL
jgi:hypothetical protein